ncbi:MAG: hypothetical protein HY364_03720 [Candidatus Aenigmarchaeota archaeon]|nr:hypothetical protein [Candidatus Aenigmarchaeota archaeon]
MADMGAYITFYTQAPICTPISNFQRGLTAKKSYNAESIAKDFWPENPDRAARFSRFLEKVAKPAYRLGRSIRYMTSIEI